MKFASEARPSQYIGPFGSTEPTCMPLSGHFMDIEGGLMVTSIKYGSYCIVATAQMKFASEARPSQYIGPFCNTEPTCMPLSGHIMDIEGRVLVYQTDRYQLSPTYNASW